MVDLLVDKVKSERLLLHMFRMAASSRHVRNKDLNGDFEDIDRRWSDIG